MNPFIIATKHVRLHTALTVAALVFSVSVALLALEGTVLQGTTPEARAWSCNLSSDTVVMDGTQETTLTWSTDSDVAYVTIDQFPDEQFGPSGTLTVSPSETTTYRMRTYGNDSTSSLECTVTVTVNPGMVDDGADHDPTCDPAELSIDGARFSWVGCPSMERYEATLCDGTTVGPVYGDWSDDVTIDLGSPIETVQACGENCHRTATAVCPVEPEAPVYPTCPFTADANTTVVHFDRDDVLYSNGTVAESKSGPHTVALTPGTYTIQTASWDGYVGRESATPQEDERWFVDLLAGDTSIAQTASTGDLADEQLSAYREDTVANDLAIATTVEKVYARHAVYPDHSSYNSVYPVCAAFVLQEEDEPEDDAPTCNVQLSMSSISVGGQATLSWSSTNATSAEFDQGIGTTSVSGSRTVAPTSDTTYTGIFENGDGESVSCSATLRLNTGGGGGVSGGGGSCLNCDDDDDEVEEEEEAEEEEEEEEEEESEPTFVLERTVRNAGNFITLDQVPYTGFEAGPIATLFFWLTVVGLSVGIAYFVTRTRPVARLRMAIENSLTQGNAVQQHATPVYSSQVAAPTPASTPSLLTRQDVSGVASDDGAGKIETAAHAHNILLSPEATRMILQAIGRAGIATDRFLDGLFEMVVATYPREDGWILLSQERAQTTLAAYSPSNDSADSAADDTRPAASQDTPAARPMLSTTHDERPYRAEPLQVREQHKVQSAQKSVVSEERPMRQSVSTAPTQQQASSAHTQESDQHAGQNGGAGVSVDGIVPLFIDLLVAGEQRKTFELLRRLNSQGESTEHFILTVVRKLDDIFKNRLEGNHNPDQALASKTANWNNHDFETVLGLLVECVDYSYSSTRIGTKVALAKVFEHFARA